jgi:hypothetical protein
LLLNPDVILGHVPIGKPLFEFAAAARTTDLLNFPHRFHRAIDILDHKTCLSFNNKFGDPEPRGKAITGVPQASASIITNPNGSGQSMGNRKAEAPPSSLFFSASRKGKSRSSRA